MQRPQIQKTLLNKLIELAEISVGQIYGRHGASVHTDSGTTYYLAVSQTVDEICLLTPQNDLIHHNKCNIFEII